MGEPAEPMDLVLEIVEEGVTILGHLLGAGLEHVDRRVHRGEGGQELVRSIRDELPLGPHALGHLARRHEHEIRVARCDRREGAVEQDPMTVPVERAELAERRSARCGAEHERLADALEVAGVEEGHEGAPDQLLHRVAELFLVRGRRIEHGSLDVDERHELLDVVHDETMKLGALQRAEALQHRTSLGDSPIIPPQRRVANATMPSWSDAHSSSGESCRASASGRSCTGSRTATSSAASCSMTARAS